jgi:uncharacterized RDD family membrane protein YckC
MADTPAGDPRRPGLIGSVVGRMAPVVMRQVDTNDLVDALDVDVIAADLDLDALVARLDVDAIAARLDLDALLARMDVNQIAERLDLDALVARLDVNDIAARLDLDALLARLDMAKLTAGAGQDVAVSGLDLVRRQIVRIDATVDGIVDRVLRRHPGDRPESPGRLADDVAERVGPDPGPHELQRRDVSGHYAGPVTRILTIVADVAAVVAVNAAIVGVVAFFLTGILDLDPSPRVTALLSLASLSTVFLAWFWIPVALFGRTLAMALLGIAVVRRDGSVVNSTRALVRAVVLPISLLAPVLFLSLLLGRERRTLHDVVADTAVVYDWGPREAEQPVTIREQLSARVRRRELGDDGPTAGQRNS